MCFFKRGYVYNFLKEVTFYSDSDYLHTSLKNLSLCIFPFFHAETGLSKYNKGYKGVKQYIICLILEFISYNFINL